MNPIEELWSKVKSLIREARPRTIEAVRRSCQQAFSQITPQDVDGWIQHAYPTLIS